MHAVVRDEVYRIAYEAIRNAYAHSRRNRLDVKLTFGEDLALRVKDNGVGIEPSVAEKGKDTHFGLKGMRERAVRIGGQLTVASTVESETDIITVVPGRVIYRKLTKSI